MRFATRHIGCCVLLLAAACADARPARIVVAGDPFLFNGPAAVQLPARVESVEGLPLEAPALSATSSDTSIVRTSGASMQCLRAGDATLTLRAGSLSTGVTIQCRPVTATFPFSYLELVSGGPAQELPVVAFDADGERVESLRFSATPEDTGIVAVEGGLARPMRLGKTRVIVDFGGITGSVAVEVVDRVHEGRIQMAAHELRSWPIDSGRYRIRALAADGQTPSTDVELLSNRANCARLNREAGTLHCVVTSAGQAVARARRAFDGYVIVDRVPE